VKTSSSCRSSWICRMLSSPLLSAMDSTTFDLYLSSLRGFQHGHSDLPRESCV
jgi:hypothetical protein